MVVMFLQLLNSGLAIGPALDKAFPIWHMVSTAIYNIPMADTWPIWDSVPWLFEAIFS